MIDPGRFPTWKFKKLIALGGFYRASGRFGEGSGTDTCYGIPWSAITRAELGPVAETVGRVLDDARRHRLCAKHFPVWCALELGVIIDRTPAGMTWRYAFPDKPRKVCDEYEAACLFSLSEPMVRQYRMEMARALDSEWMWLTTREILDA